MKKKINAVLLIGFFTIVSSSAQNKISWERYDDDFIVLRKDTIKNGLDKLKYIPLSKSSNLSLGGELREQFQYYENQNFGDVPSYISNPNAIQIWHRAMAHANLELGSKVRFFAQLGSAFRFANPDPLLAQIDENQLNEYYYRSKTIVPFFVSLVPSDFIAINSYI